MRYFLNSLFLAYICFFLLSACTQDKEPKQESKNKSEKNIATSTEHSSGIEQTPSVEEETSVAAEEYSPLANEEKKKQEYLVVPAASEKATIDLSATATVAFLQKNYTPGEKFKVSSEEEKRFVTQRGTVIKIPKECFLNSKGMYERGEIIVEVQEIKKGGDLFMMNLPTVSEGKMLESAGVIYLNASAAGKPLTIVEGKNIEVAYAADKIDPEMMLFDLGHGEIPSWVNPRKIEKEKFPRKKRGASNDFQWKIEREAYSSKGKSFDYSSDGTLTTEHIYGVPKNKSEKDAKELSDRLKYFSILKALCEMYGKVEPQVDSYISYYINAPGSNFNAMDTKVYNQLKKFSDYYEFSNRTCIEWFYKEDTLFRGMKDVFDQFQLYSLKKNWMPSDLSSYGIDLSSRNPALALEMKAKLSKEDAQAVVEYCKFKAEMDKNISAAKASYMENLKRRQAAEGLRQTLSYAFSVNKLGYINIDKFTNEQNTVATNITIKVKDIGKADIAKVGIIFKNRKSYLEIYPDQQGSYVLSKGTLPLNEPIRIIAVLYKGDKILYGKKEINTAAIISESLDMNAVLMEQLKKELSQM